MTISNRFTFEQLREQLAKDAANAGLPMNAPLALAPQSIMDLQEDLVARAESLKADKALLDRLMGEQFAKTATDQYSAAKKDSGKVTASLDDANDLVMDRKKSVEWNQELLAGIKARIAKAGDDPAVYIVTSEPELTVKEAAFEAWPDAVKAEFLPARTVKVADTKFLVQPKKKAK